MRTSVWVAIALLAVMIGGGIASGAAVKEQSDRYLSAAEEMRILVADKQWQRAQQTAQAYRERWKETSPWLQMIIDHEDIDSVTLALEHLLAGLEGQDEAECFNACVELREHAQHLYHRDAFTLSNVL